jgi:hypothetical protein
LNLRFTLSTTPAAAGISNTTFLVLLVFDANGEATSADTTRARIRMRRFRDGTARSSYEVPDKRMEQRRCVKEPDSMSQPVDGRSPRKKAALVKKVVFDEV